MPFVKFIVLLVSFVNIVLIDNVSAMKNVPETKQQIQLSFSPLVKKTSGAVVNIYTAKKVRVRTSPFLGDPLFNRFFGDNLLFGGQNKERIQNTLGSGVIIRNDGIVITNNHVINDADDIKVVLSDKREFSAKVIITDKKTDLALLQLNNKKNNLPFIPFGNNDNLEVGDLVLAIGNPFGVGQTVTSGIVSALARTAAGISDYEFFIQTDAAINPGNSGGALINMRGELIGINTAIFSKAGGSNGIGFATPSVMGKLLLSSHNSNHKKVIRPWLGATGQNITNDIAESLDISISNGVLIKDIFPGGPSDRAGLKVGDIIVRIGEYKVNSSQELLFRTSTSEIGKVVDFVLSGGEVIKIKMEKAPEIPKRDSQLVEGENPVSGAIIANLSPAFADELSISKYKGVIVTDVQLRTYARRFLKVGDIIKKINSKKIKSASSLVDYLSDTNVRKWNIQILRGNKIINIDISY